MAASRTLSPEPTQEVFSWLKNLPLAPEYHPTVAEFQDPIGYIFKIEKEASMYGICKIVPPVPPAPKKSIISNFNRSLAARARENPAQSSPTFTTRQQQIGFCPRKPCPVKKPVWQSGESYTLQDFEAKARAFERNYLKKCSKKGNPSALEIETLYWKATVDKPFSVEYANDMPGSAFAPLSSRKGRRDAGEGQGNVGDSNWNMRGVSRSNGSLLRFMKEEIPGVTSPMVYVAMLFSWFAWHVEDHDLHSLNYLHMGAGKTWYGVPRDAAVAFEEVVRVQGYGGEVNPLVTFAILGEKTTVISPEVLVGAGVPCCRLVQNAGEFVVTFPRAYHSGFSHGFNCGEAANIATPEWLRVAKEAAIRRASINYPPMVSHFQLLYDLALALCTRVPSGINTVPRSSRLKDKKKGEGESMIKDQFVQDVIQNNDLLHILGKGSSVVLLPQNSADISVYTNFFVGANSRLTLGLCDPDEVMKSPKNFGSENNMSDRKRVLNPLKGPYSMNAKFASLCERKRFSFSGNGDVQTPDSQTPDRFTGDDKTALGDMLSDQRLFSCVTCGILTFSCAAILQPREPAARYLMSAECSFFNDWTVNSGIPSEGFSIADGRALASGQRHFGGLNRRGIADGLYDLPVQAADFEHQSPHPSDQVASSTGKERGTSALGLIGLNYGNSSDSEDEHIEGNPSDDESAMRASSLENGETGPSSKDRSCQNSDTSAQLETSMRSANLDSKYGSIPVVKPSDTSYVPKSDEDSSRMHVFCLEHAIEVEKQLRPIGGVDVYLICHPEYPKVEAEAKLVAEELGNNYLWHDVTFRNAYKEDEDRIKAALDSEDAIPSSGDWAVKLGINLFYSVRLSWSSLYSKQMPYNSVIYNAFGRSSSMKYDDECGKRSKRKVVVGKWCGKVWMSNQIHPFLAQKDDEDVERQEEDEEEEERNFNASVIREEKPVRRSVGKSGNNNMVTKKDERKRKTAAPCRASKKSRSICKEDDEEEEVAASDDSLVKRAKSFKREDLVFSSKGKSVEKEYSNSDDNSMEETYRQLQPHRRIYRSGNNKAAQFTPVEDVMNSDVSQSGDSQQEKEVSDDSGGIDSHHHQQQQQQQLPKMYSRRKQARNHNYADHNDNVVLNDNLLEGKSLRQPRSLRNKRQKQTGNQIVRTLNCEMSPPVIKPLNQGLKGRISLPVRQRTPRIVSKEVITPRPKSDSKYESGESGERQSSESCEEEEPQRGPSTRLRTRSSAPAKRAGARTKGSKQITSQKKKMSANASPAVKKKVTGSTSGSKMRAEEGEYHCDLEGCAMSFTSKQELILHKKNICPVKGCGKKFFSHKYLVQHRRVHMDDRPLKCPWKGCKMTFKWAWARTEHIRVHTGVRPYVCGEPGCGQTFRFVSDFSRHKRKTGHSVKGKG